MKIISIDKNLIPNFMLQKFLKNCTSPKQKTIFHTLSQLFTSKKVDVLFSDRLFDLERIQIINFVPKKLVDLSVFIEDMEERFSIDELEMILKDLEKYE